MNGQAMAAVVQDETFSLSWLLNINLSFAVSLPQRLMINTFESTCRFFEMT